MKVLVCGSRDWTDNAFLCKALDKERAMWSSDGVDWLCLIEGDATGADRMAGAWARANGIQPVICPALWNFYGKSAGPRRNAVQAYLQPDICIAFHSDIRNSRGTKHMVSLMEKSRVTIYTGKEDPSGDYDNLDEWLIDD